MSRTKEPEPPKQPRKPDPPFDAIQSLERELSVLLAWRTRLSADAYERNERDIEKIKAHIDRRLIARGKPTRYSGDVNAVAWDGTL